MSAPTAEETGNPGSDSVTPDLYQPAGRLPALGPGRPQAAMGLLPQLVSLAERIADTEFVPKELRRRPEAIIAALLAGAERGFAPMESLRSVHVIEGRPTLSAEAMRALVLSRGHSIKIVKAGLEEAELIGRRRGDEEWSEPFAWTMEDARRAGLAGKDVWKRYPRAMLLARASTELCRAVFPDVVAGLMSAEEATDTFLDATYASESSAPALEPASGAGAAADESGPAAHDLGLQRRLHRKLTTATPGIPTKTRDRWRHALCIIVTRRRESGPSASSGDLTMEEQLQLSGLLARLETGEATIADTPEGLVELHAGGRWNYLVRLVPPGVDVWQADEEAEAGSDAGTQEQAPSASEPAEEGEQA